jgi:peptidoglycan/xylan/chitin deacetylase (PgdA/CDA1 family)
MSGKSMLAVSVDIEDWYHTPSVTGSLFSRYKDVKGFFDKWQDRYDYLSAPTNTVLDLLDRLNVHATFFIVADVTEHYPGLVEKIVDKGHEIACHGLHHACAINRITKKAIISQKDFEARMAEAKRELEKICKEKVIGFRAPSAYIAGWMLDSLERVGYKYDSSVCVNSLYNKSDSKPKNVTTVPYYPEMSSLERGEEKRILEIPWAYLNILRLKFPTSGGPFLRFLGARYIMSGLKQSLKMGDTVFYFHPLDISNDKFPVVFSAKRPFYWCIKGEVVERRIKHILTNINTEFSTCRDIWEKHG